MVPPVPGRTGYIFYEGDNPTGFASQIQAEFGFSPALNHGWGEQIAGDDISFTSYGFYCPPEHLDAIYGNSRFPMGRVARRRGSSEVQHRPGHTDRHLPILALARIEGRSVEVRTLGQAEPRIPMSGTCLRSASDSGLDVERDCRTRSVAELCRSNDQGVGAARRRWPGVRVGAPGARRALPWAARPAHAGPHSAEAADQHGYWARTVHMAGCAAPGRGSYYAVRSGQAAANRLIL